MDSATWAFHVAATAHGRVWHALVFRPAAEVPAVLYYGCLAMRSDGAHSRAPLEDLPLDVRADCWKPLRDAALEFMLGHGVADADGPSVLDSDQEQAALQAFVADLADPRHAHGAACAILQARMRAAAACFSVPISLRAGSRVYQGE